MLGRETAEPVLQPDAVFCSGFRVGGVSVQVAGARGADVTLAPSLEPFRIPNSSDTNSSDIKVQVEWAAKLHRGTGHELFDSGSIWRLFEDEGGFRFEFRTAITGNNPYKRLVVDNEFKWASLLLNEECFRDREFTFPLEYPLDEVLITHRLALEEAIELHGCGIVGPDRTGNLFIGHSGAGKSTTARLWAALPGVDILSDDRVIVRRERPTSAVEMPYEGGGAVQGVEILRLRRNFAPRRSRSAQDDKMERASPQGDGKKTSGGEIRMYGTPWHGEAAFASPASASLSRILILEQGHGNVVTPLSPSQAVAELFARSFVPFHRHEYLEHALEFLQAVVDAVPVYRFAFEPDQRSVDTILNLHE
jgi:hypothetical protein